MFLVFTPLLCACVLQYEVGAPVGVESDHGSVTITSHGSSSRVVGFVQVLACNYGTPPSLTPALLALLIKYGCGSFDGN